MNVEAHVTSGAYLHKFRIYYGQIISVMKHLDLSFKSATNVFLANQ